MRLPDEVGQGFEKWLQAKLHQPSRLIGCEAKCKLGCGAYEPKQHSSSDCNEDIFPDLLRVELDMKAKGCGCGLSKKYKWAPMGANPQPNLKQND